MRNINKINKCKKHIIKPLNKNILEEIKNYSSDVRKYGFVLIIESEEIKEYYSSQISNIMVNEKWKEMLDEKYVLKQKITSSRIYNFELAKLLLEDQLGKYKVSHNYYLCGIDKIKEVYKNSIII